MVWCRQCGLVYRSSLSGAGEGSEDHSGVEEDKWLAERRSGNFRRLLDGWDGPPGKLLDVGCGYGWFLQLARERGWDAVGVDVSLRAVRHARDRLGVPAFCGDLKSCRFPDGAFALVTLWNMLEFVPDPVELLEEIRRVLRPGGTLFLRTQNFVFQRLSFLLTRWARRPQWPYRPFVFHVNSFSPASIRFLFRRTGFVALKVANSPPTWGDPYRAFGGADHLLAAVKLGVHSLAQALYVLSGGRWILGASLESYARPEG